MYRKRRHDSDREEEQPPFSLKRSKHYRHVGPTGIARRRDIEKPKGNHFYCVSTTNEGLLLLEKQSDSQMPSERGDLDGAPNLRAAVEWGYASLSPPTPNN